MVSSWFLVLTLLDPGKRVGSCKSKGPCAKDPRGSGSGAGCLRDAPARPGHPKGQAPAGLANLEWDINIYLQTHLNKQNSWSKLPLS